MKTTLTALCLLCLVSCSQSPPPNFKPWGPSGRRQQKPATAAPPATALTPKVQKAAPQNKPAPALAERTPPAGSQTNATAAALPQRATAPEPIVTPTNTMAKTVTSPVPTNALTQIAPPQVGPASSANATGTQDIIPAGTINFPATDLNQVLQIYAELVNRTVLRPANLPAPLITLKTQTPLTKKEAVQAFDAVLALNGIAMINVGTKFVKAVPIAQAGKEAGQISFTNNPAAMPNLGQYVTHVVQLKYVKPSDMVQVLQPFSKAPNAILPIDSSQILVLRDYAENVKRMLQMIKEVDVPVPSEYVSEVIPIKYAKATDIANALNSLSSGGGSTTIGGGSSGGSAGTSGAAAYARPGMGRTGYRSGMTGYAPGSTMYGQQSSDITPLSGPVAGSAPYGPQANDIRPMATAPGGNSFTQRLRNIINSAHSSNGSKQEIQILGQTKIIADERSNSLLVFASRQDMKMIKSIVSKLDVVLAQVIIQTIIMDVQMDNGWNVGVTASQNPKQYNSTVAGGGGYNNGQSYFNQFLNMVNSASTNAFLGSLATGGLSYWAKLGKVWNLALEAAASDERINVIQRPQILTTHATPGSIFIGSTVPYITSTYYGGAYGGGPSSSYQQLQVGIGLTVTPYINSDGLVVMQIDESIDELSGSTTIQGVGNVPNTTSRRLSAEVAVPDGDTIMLGGFIRNSNDRKNSGVPLLKDIPLLGSLFSSRSDTRSRKELIVLMRPTVLKTPKDAAEATAAAKAQLPGVESAEAEVKAEEQKERQRELKRVSRAERQISAGNQNASKPAPGSE